MKDGISIVMAYHNRRKQLINTLKSVNNTLFDKNKLEIIIVNDNSSDVHSINDLPVLFPDLTFFILNIKEKQKKWINSCIPYNIGFNQVKYNKVVIQNPECYHNGDILIDVNERLNDGLYLSYGCYSLTPTNTELENYSTVKIKSNKCESPCGDGWYNHSSYRPTFYHFCAAISYNNLCKLNGFDERYKDGIGFDDNEIIERIKYLGLELKIINDPFVFHQAHNSVFHFNHESSTEDKKRKTNLFYNNKNIFDNITTKLKKYKADYNSYFNPSIV